MKFNMDTDIGQCFGEVRWITTSLKKKKTTTKELIVRSRSVVNIPNVICWRIIKFMHNVCSFNIALCMHLLSGLVYAFISSSVHINLISLCSYWIVYTLRYFLGVFDILIGLHFFIFCKKNSALCVLWNSKVNFL